MNEFLPGSAGLLAPLQTWLNDKAVSEILVNKPKEVWIENTNGLQWFEVKS